MRDWLSLPSAGRDKGPDMAAIVAAVAERFNVTPDALRGPRRSRCIAWPRQVAMWLGVLDGTRSSVQVGIYFRRDHTTVLHARNCIEGQTKRCKVETRAHANLRRTAGELADALKIRRGFYTGAPVYEMSPVKHQAERGRA
jgi:chromosomal replication initiation ATPase DnaA